jgi:hypothetical protein
MTTRFEVGQQVEATVRRRRLLGYDRSILRMKQSAGCDRRAQPSLAKINLPDVPEDAI